MLYNFNKFINESKEDEFRSLKKGDIILYSATRFEVKKADEYQIALSPVKKVEGEPFKTVKVNLSQYKEKGGGIIQKAKKEENED